MTNFFHFRIFLVWTLTLLWVRPACGQKPAPQNYVVLLDLSDRLLAPGQPQRDQALILDVFARFERAVRRNLIVNSRDGFRVVIAPQAGQAFDADALMGGLFLTMDGPIATKRRRFDAFKAALPGRLRQLYQLSLRGKTRPADFRGCDLWQYFNEQLPGDLPPAAQNTLLILTDGYFDFENNTHRMQRDGRATDSQQLMARLRRDPQWRKTLQLPDVGLLPVSQKLAPLRVWVAEINPKVDHLEELAILKAVWQKWLTEMQAAAVTCVSRSPLPKVRQALQAIP